ncbi:hypothetical protein [Actinoplanes aureus]|uniref:Uncharacterized protein n=1 Tax=Actinoplanes aureus TaxID=2792083 RepID=A0A931CHU6_9ACTN|nr:hypothetical protein [Actinoplanes aureus]MBG0567548.1 hypothetical protein [Actinoplanes aureus]
MIAPLEAADPTSIDLIGGRVVVGKQLTRSALDLVGELGSGHLLPLLLRQVGTVLPCAARPA